MRIEIDESKCCGAGQCVLAAPKVFDQRDEDGVVILLDASPPAEMAPDVKLAVDLCPAQVITIIDDDAGDKSHA